MHSRDTTMTIWEHLEELRWVLIKSFAAVAVCTCIGFTVANRTLRLLLLPSRRVGPDVELIFNGPLDGFMTQLKMAALAGSVLAAPVVLYFVVRFVAPALEERERRAARVLILGGTGCFVGGIAFGYGLLFFSLPVLAGFGVDGVQQMWSLALYLDFCFKVMLGTGLAFETPVVLLVLVQLGILSAETMARSRRYAILGIVLVAAFVTPDQITLVMVAVPLWVLYEITIVIGKVLERRRRSRAADKHHEDKDLLAP